MCDFMISHLLGIVLGVVSYGGVLLATNQVSPGDLMSFLVATQTIQRWVFIGIVSMSRYIVNKAFCYLLM